MYRVQGKHNLRILRLINQLHPEKETLGAYNSVNIVSQILIAVRFQTRQISAQRPLYVNRLSLICF